MPRQTEPGTLGGGASLLPRWLRALFAWRTVCEAGVYAYQQNDLTGRRRAIRLSAAGHSPLDWGWIESGSFTPPPQRPSAPPPLRRPGDLPAHVSIFPHFNVYAPAPRGKDQFMAHTNVQVPSYGEIAERQNYHQMQSDRDFWKREAERAHDELRNIPAAVEKWGFVEFDRPGGTMRLVAQAEGASE